MRRTLRCIRDRVGQEARPTRRRTCTTAQLQAGEWNTLRLAGANDHLCCHRSEHSTRGGTSGVVCRSSIPLSFLSPLEEQVIRWETSARLSRQETSSREDDEEGAAPRAHLWLAGLAAKDRLITHAWYHRLVMSNCRISAS